MTIDWVEDGLVLVLVSTIESLRFGEKV
jgi:hypothetical protein